MLIVIKRCVDTIFYYKIYGLRTASQLQLADVERAEIPALSAGDTDVSILIGDVDVHMEENPETVWLAQDWYYLALPDSFYMHCQGYDFEITGGVQIKLGANALYGEGTNLQTYILGSAFGVLCLQRGHLPIHGAAIKLSDGGAAILTGHAGAGKSATLDAFLSMGYRYIADDVSVVKTGDAASVVIPAYPQRKLAAETARETGMHTDGYTLLHEDGREKYAIREIGEWADEEAPLVSIVELNAADRKDGAFYTPEARLVTGHGSLSIVLRNLYRQKFWESIGVPPVRMKQLLKVTSETRIYQIYRPLQGFPVKETAELIREKCFTS